MPLFKVATSAGRERSGQLQTVLCPRCKVELEPEGEIRSYGDGVTKRVVEGTYTCSCDYRIEVKESYPVINRALDTTRHI
jgi:hypothetical protein